ncbi:MAG: hypothetical protein EB157_02125, partial [Euryarchaeota archaeon]|nr:hypothetical protein [Euryarchaeota archaeon]
RQAAIDAVNALITTLQTEAAARLTRIEALEADPTTEVRSSEAAAISSGVLTWWDKNQQEDEVEASHLLDDELPVVDLTGDE